MIRNRFATGLLLVSVLCAVAIANAAEPAPPVALLSAGRGLLEWIPLVESDGMTLTLANPRGVVGSRHFPPGEAPALSLFDTHGMPLSDGTYTWELRAAPRDSAPLVQSGTFSISGGSLVAPDRSEPPAEDLRVATAPDQMVPDDLIIDGKGCIGLGCVNNEAFGTEALRLKQSVVRLRFHDTSTNASFPTNDWQIAVNDSASGGANRFSIEDVDGNKTPLTVRAGAPDNSVYVDSAGRVGLGTATPAERLHVLESLDVNTIITSENVNAGLNAAGALRAKSNSAIVNFQAHGSGRTLSRFGQSLASWAEFLQVAGNGLIIGTLADKPLILGTNNTNRIHISPSGFVGIGTANPSGTLHLFGNAADDVFAGMGIDLAGGPAFNYGYSGYSFGRSSGFFNIRPDPSAVAPNPSLRFLTSNVQRMIIDNEGFLGLGVANPTSPIQHSSGASLSAGGVWVNASSRDAKEDISDLTTGEALTTLQGLSPVKFAYKANHNERHVGFIAEDVPDLVASPDRKTLSPMDLVAVLTKVVQEQQSTIEELAATLGELREKLDEIEMARP